MRTGDRPKLEEIIARLDALCRETTPGEWISFVEGRDHESGSDFIQTGGDDIELIGGSTSDQDFVAFVHRSLPRILSELKHRSPKFQLVAATDLFNRCLHVLRDAGYVHSDRLSADYRPGSEIYEKITAVIEESLSYVSGDESPDDA